MSLKDISGLLKIACELSKVRITFFVAFSTSIGYILYSGEVSWRMIFTAFGVFVLACGSSAMNHYQERFIDLKMERTKGRPIPSGRVSPFSGLLFSVMLLIFGSLILFLAADFAAMFLGWTAFIWYNVIYTPLKMRYALAVVPGAFIGAIPPVIGWVAAGGKIDSPHIISLALFFFIWQVPHFWLLLMIHKNDYEKAGFPTLTALLNDAQLKRITFIWIAALAISGMLIPLFASVNSIMTVILMLGLGLFLIINSGSLLKRRFERVLYKKTFMYINIYMLIVVLVLSFDKIINL